MELKDFIAKQMEARPTEVRIIRKAIRAMKNAGTPIVAVFDGGEEVAVKTEMDIFTEVFNLDSAWIQTADGSFIFLTMGEEWDVICDYTTDLEETLKPVYEYIDKYQD